MIFMMMIACPASGATATTAYVWTDAVRRPIEIHSGLLEFYTTYYLLLKEGISTL